MHEDGATLMRTILTRHTIRQEKMKSSMFETGSQGETITFLFPKCRELYDTKNKQVSKKQQILLTNAEECAVTLNAASAQV